MKRVRRVGRISALFIDYELESGARKIVDELLGSMRCDCGSWVNGVRCCSCAAGMIIVLFEGGPEGSLEHLGHRLDNQLKDVLKSHKLLEAYRRQGRVKDLVDSLLETVKRVCREFLGEYC